MKSIKNENGSLALFVTIAVLFFMAFLLVIYVSTTNEQKTQLAITARVKEVYEKNLEDKVLESIYEEMIGKEENIPIYTAEQLEKIGSGENVYIQEVKKYYNFKLDSNYELKNDIEINKGNYTIGSDGTVTFNSNSKQWTPIGTTTSPFSGTFNGNNYKIKGLYINNTTLNNQGLFGCNNGTIKNVILCNGFIKAGGNVGGIVAFSKSNSKIYNCINVVTIQARDPVGGIVGRASGSIENCINNANIIGIDNSWNIGGIFGRATANETLIVKNSYNTGDISVTRGQVGGIGGVVQNVVAVTIENCYNTGKINGSTRGGIIGWNNGNLVLKNCYYLIGTSSTGIGYISIDDAEGIVEAKPETFMQSLGIIDLRNTNKT